MEEDIKIVEEYIEWVKKEGIEVCGMEKELPAIENILHELKYNKIQFATQLREKLDLQASTIPISVIQNKIDKLEPQVHLLRPNAKPCEMMREFKVEGALIVLQELLEERNK